MAAELAPPPSAAGASSPSDISPSSNYYYYTDFYDDYPTPDLLNLIIAKILCRVGRGHAFIGRKSSYKPLKTYSYIYLHTLPFKTDSMSAAGISSSDYSTLTSKDGFNFIV